MQSIRQKKNGKEKEGGKMRAKIIAKDHNVIKYTVNDKARYIVELNSHPSNNMDKEVFHVIDQVGFDRHDVINYFHKRCPTYYTGEDFVFFQKLIDKHTI